MTPAPTLPVAISSPERIGSWPEVKTWSPLRTAGTYDRHRLGDLGDREAELGQPLLGGAHEASGRLK